MYEHTPMTHTDTYSMPAHVKRELWTLEALMMAGAPMPPMTTTNER